MSVLYEGRQLEREIASRSRTESPPLRTESPRESSRTEILIKKEPRQGRSRSVLAQESETNQELDISQDKRA